ncbi:MAG: Uma2 family endonuclease [Spirochaetales bacterium]|nr:Uma2 family endonuclease [Spirochaetales bacterium]
MLEVLEKPAIRRAVIPIDIQTYRKMFAGLKTELIQGAVIEKVSKSKLHAGVLRLLFKYFSSRVNETIEILKEDPITLIDSEPEPDLAIVPARHSIHDEHPTFAYLVVEVSVTTQAIDAEKADMYARGNIPVYWNILPLENTTVVYSKPNANGYTSEKRIPFSEPLSIALPGHSMEVVLESILK